MKTQEIKITKPKIEKMEITIEGLTSLLVNRLTPEKIKPQPREEKDDDIIFQECLYPSNNGTHSFIAMGIKKAMIEAAFTFAKAIKKTVVRGAIFIPVEFVPVTVGIPRIRKDVTRTGRGDAIEMIRAEFPLPWEMTVPIEFDKGGRLSPEVIIGLLDVAGYHVGLGCWRPSSKSGGIFGRFQVKENK